MHLQELAEITAGTVSGANVAFDTVSIDTRTITEGALFVAISGPNFDGNDFVSAAAEKKAAAAVVSQSSESELPTITVQNTRKALGELGLHNRRQSEALVIGLTGSQGKTTVKEMLAKILSQHASTMMTRGNLNNDLGVPLTLLQIQSSHKFAVIEMGANAPGEIAYTTSLVEPDIAHITNAAGTHLEGFGSIEGVAYAKGEIWSGVRKGGIAVINVDDAYADLWIKQSGSARVVTISAGGNRQADYFVSNIALAGVNGSGFVLHSPVGEVNISLSLLGNHNIANALAAAAMALEAGVGLDTVKQGLAAMTPVSGRMTITKGFNGCCVIDDSYNASPASFKAAIDVLAEMTGETVLVVGDMAELGDEAEQAHRELGVYASNSGVKRLFAIGELSAKAAEEFDGDAEYSSSCELLAERLKTFLRADVTVLVKGSRSAGMEKLVRLITTQEGS